jgi:hypothetical protein
VREKTISVFVSHQQGWFVAECVEHDIATQVRYSGDADIRRTITQAIDDVERMLRIRVESSASKDIDPWDVRPAPESTRLAFERGIRFMTRKTDVLDWDITLEVRWSSKP